MSLILCPADKMASQWQTRSGFRDALRATKARDAGLDQDGWLPAFTLPGNAGRVVAGGIDPYDTASDARDWLAARIASLYTQNKVA